MFSYQFDTPTLLILSLFIACLSLLAAAHALLGKRDSKAALAWVAFCLVIPVYGPLIYLVFGINRTSDKAQEIYPASSPIDARKSLQNPEAARQHPMSRVGEAVTGHGLRSCDDVKMLENGEALYPRMLQDIAAATDRVYCSTYIFQRDETGLQFLNALIEARNRGVDVRVILDGLGGIAYPPVIGKVLAKSGLNYKQFNPITLLPPSLHVNMRNHRKILIVDGDIAFTGGHNIGDRHLVQKPNNPKCARDLHFRFTGKSVDDLERAFLKDWLHCTGETGAAEFTPGNSQRSDAEIWTRVIMDGPNENLDKLNDLLVGMLALARKRIWIMTPYFLPGLDLIGALVSAKLRGVDVKILLPERTNIHLAHWAAQHNLRHILARDLAVFLQPAPFIHTKALLIDDEYTLIGSANLDPRSLRLNFELGVEIFDPRLANQLAQYFAEKLAAARPLSEPMLDAVPAWMRVRNALAWLFSPYL